ncbi:MAG: fibronectin type III domain-containing protein [Paludibacteraceae bacterium]|nr:fibronectin type III domain-containing protein [Paludibacteraceae bacterium]
MKRFLLFLTFCTAVLCASASNKYVKPDGDDSKDGKSWENAFATIQTAVWGVPAGDTVFIAEGLYNQAFSVSDGQTILGGYNAATGERDIELYETVLDGTDLGKWIIVKYDAPPATLITIDGLTMQNAEHSSEGGAMFMRGNMIVSNCKFINCHGSNGGAIHVEQGNAAVQAVIRNCLIELCSSTSSGGAIRNKGALIENCVIRGCQGKYGTIRNESGGIVRNCVLYNNSASVSGWPNSGGIYNDGGQVYNCTVCNNWGEQYAGYCSEAGGVYNSVFWGNRAVDGFTEHVNYISSSASGSHNVADDASTSSGKFLTPLLNSDNNVTDGPNFRNPTTFVGAPQDAGQIAAMRNADFSLTDASAALLDKGDVNHAPEQDIDGVIRPKGDGVDIGAYEYDPDAVVIAVTGVSIVQDTLKVIKGQSGTLIALIEPANANNKRLNWTIDDETIATIHNGAVTGLKEDTTIAHVQTQDGGFTASAVVVVLPVPQTKYPDEVLAADELYKIEDYTVPSFIPFLIAKEAARIDSLNPESDLPSIAGKIDEMNTAIANLVGKEEPYNMVANINGNPMTRMAFCWFTNAGVTQGQVQILPMANATAADFEQGTNMITLNAQSATTPALQYAVSTSGIAKAAKLPGNTKFVYESHSALAENLTPGTAYSWRVGNEGHWSEIGHFRTQDNNQGEFSFLYMSDSHIMDAEYVENAKWCATAAAATAPDARFCLFPGDFVETGTAQNSEWEWERWFEESIKPVIMQMPIVPTDGNHDDSPNLNYDYHFNTPTDFAMSVPASYRPQFHGITYSFVYGDVLFLVYSLQDWWRSSSGETSMASTYLSTDVKNWFKEQIALHPNTKYRVTLAHKNIFSGSGHSEDNEIPLFRKFMLPILKECEIDLAIQGHDHCYEVIGPVDWDTWAAVEGAVTDVETVPVNTNTNMTGKKGGTFVTDNGTMYFIGATCGRKRYYPYSREKMEEKYTTDPALLFDGNHHNVPNYFDLFTGMFGQPGAPSFTKFTVKADCLEINSYTADKNGNATLINTMQVKRTKPHSKPNGFDYISADPKEGQKFIRDGHLYILRNGRIFDATGKLVK